MCGIHPDQELQKLFPGWQNRKPEDEGVLVVILGTDPNWPREKILEKWRNNKVPSFWDKHVKPYLERGGIDYYLHGNPEQPCHHFHLSKEKPRPIKEGGWRYHFNASKLYQNPSLFNCDLKEVEILKRICFVELCGIPTEGQLNPDILVELFEDAEYGPDLREKLAKLGKILVHKKDLIILVCNNVIQTAKKFLKSRVPGVAESAMWLKPLTEQRLEMGQSIPLINHKSVCFLKFPHFSATQVHNEIKAMQNNKAPYQHLYKVLYT